MSLFSIIVPVYNASKTLRQCIESILKQSFKDFELILVNDGSTDDSGKIAEDYIAKDGRVKIIHKENGGVSSTRNRGIKEAKGRYLLFIDSDDRIGDDFLLGYYEILKEFPSALIYQGFVSEYLDRNVVEALSHAVYEQNEIVDALAILEEKRCLGGAWNKVFVRDIIEKKCILFNEEFSYGEDKIFTLQYIQYINQIVFIDKTEYFYNRKIENSLSKKHHKVAELKKFIEKERYYFNAILEKYPNSYFREIVDSRYSSFAKYILLSMYRKNENISRGERENWRKDIINFDKQSKRLEQFEIEVPTLVNKFYKNDVIMKFFMFFRENFMLLYRLTRR
ncbi:glycosyltransferase [Riemerella anatipestifer]|nr:glycosyltransferase [Riemerella anatipestifer]MDY3357676.1 glycosyltransferase [Riemerella anatipestifer]